MSVGFLHVNHLFQIFKVLEGMSQKSIVGFLTIIVVLVLRLSRQFLFYIFFFNERYFKRKKHKQKASK